VSARERRVLVLWYSQSGQLHRAASTFVAPLEEAGLDVRWERLTPRREYPFPWGLADFLRAFPDAVNGRACPLEPSALAGDEHFDLVVLAYTVWYLSPSVPAQSLFASPLRGALADTPVITLIACRNMWFSAERKMRRMIREAGGIHAGTVAVTDDGPAWATFVTTPRWLLTGKQGRFLRIFPPAGISDASMAALRPLGQAVLERWDRLRGGGEPALFAGLSPTSVDRPMVLPDLLIGRLFRPWGRALAGLQQRGRRQLSLGYAVFGLWLVLAVVTVVSLLAVAQLVLHPVTGRITDRYLDLLDTDPQP
jgi:hypothetical protein